MKILRRLWPYYRSQWLMVILSLAQIGAAVSLGVAAPLIVRWVVDRVLVEGNWNWLLPGALAVVAASLVQGVLRFGQRYTMESVSQRVIFDVRSDLYRHLQELSFGFYDRAQTGELMSRVTADVEALRQACGMGVVNGLMHAGTIVGIMIAMFGMNWKMALVSLTFFPFLLYAVRQFSVKVRPAWYEIQRETATMSAMIQENLAGVRVVRAFAREREEIARFRVQNERFQDRNLKAIRMQAFWSQYMNFLTAVGAVCVLWFGGHQVIAGAMSVGTLIAFNTYVANLSGPVGNLGFIVSIMVRAGASAQRVFELLDTRSDVQELPGARELGPVKGHVHFENVSFGYGSGEPVLADINLEAKPGMRVAILGMTGSGKSSLINLIPRFYDPTGGRVLIDGNDIREVTLESLRGNIAMVLQETFLFSTSLRENIAYGRPGATMDEVIAAAKAAQIHEFIMGLPEQYETEVGERGVGLSGGQKQRMAIARALLVGSPILLLDESTSAVDVETEGLIQTAMDKVMQGRTAFVIASRLTTVMNADLVVVLENGRIAAVGKHHDLIQQDGLYRKIYELQLKPAEEYARQKEAAI
ncbi:MAG: transporter ATP-binding protein [Firmicutes bacterium]|nr:transporter ATP-binding protein [Bacillota bacterium]